MNGIPSLDQLPTLLWMQSGHVWLSGLGVHMAGTFPASHPPEPPNPSGQGCSQSVHPPACVDIRGCPDSGHLELGFVKPHEIPICLLLKLFKSLRMSSHPSGVATAPLQLWCHPQICQGAFDPTVHIINKDIK